MKINVNSIHDSLLPVGVSQLGTPVYDNVVFPAGSYFTIEGQKLTYEEVKLDSVTLTVNRVKKIVKSSVSGRKGEISEYIGFGNYTITLNAIIAPDILGIEDTEMLGFVKKLDDVPDRVPILSKFLNNIYGITYVVIEEMESSKIVSDSYSVRMSMYGDESIDLKGFG